MSQGKIKIDQKDLQILKILQENGKITNLELSSMVGLSPAPTLERVRKLERKGVIKNYHAEIDEKLLGLGISALIQVSLAHQLENAIQKFSNQIQEIENVVECLRVTGRFDFLLKVMVKDINALDDLITNKLSKIDEIGHMESFMILNTVKKSWVAPIDYHQTLKI